MARHHPYPTATGLLLLGTNRGLFIVSSQGRKTWRIIADCLPPIYAVSAGPLA